MNPTKPIVAAVTRIAKSALINLLIMIGIGVIVAIFNKSEWIFWLFAWPLFTFTVAVIVNTFMALNAILQWTQQPTPVTPE